MLKDDSYSRVMGPYVKYQENILELLYRPIPWQSFVILEGFWPFNSWKTNYEHASICTVVDVDPKNPIILPYCGFRSMCPFLNIVAYTPYCDLFIGNFVLVQPLNLTIYPIWMERVESDVVRD